MGRHGQRHLGVDADGARALGLVMTRRLPEPRNWIDRSAGGGYGRARGHLRSDGTSCPPSDGRDGHGAGTGSMTNGQRG